MPSTIVRTFRPVRGSAFLLTALVFVGGAFAIDDPDVLPHRFRLEPILTGTARPSGIAIAPDGRIFFGERTTGNVRIVRGGTLEVTPFATIAVSSAGAGEGLLDVALHPDFAGNHWVYVSYTASGTGEFHIDRYTESAGLGVSPLAILTLPASPGGTRIGGSMVFGKDGKLYVTTGDFEDPANGQDSSALEGKILRLNDDGSIPADNPVAASAVYAEGFRNGGGLGVNRAVGTLYQTDQGDPPGVMEECNAVPEGNTTLDSYGWSLYSGSEADPGHVDPLTEHATLVTPSAVLAYEGTRYPASYQSNIFYGCQAVGNIEAVEVGGAKMDTFVSTGRFYDPLQDGDGTPDADCPKEWADADVSGDGYVYLTVDANGAANGIYRILYDDSAGPREVSPAGSTHPLLVEKLTPTDVRLTFEDQKKDAFVGPPLYGSQHDSKYTIWAGSLPIDTNGDGTPDWSHVAVATTDGTTVNEGVLSHDLVTGGGSEYFLVSSQNADLEGPTGFGSGGTPIPGYATTDWCDGHYGTSVGDCAPEFEDKLGNPLMLPDEFGVLHSLLEFRTGDVVHLDLGATDCFWCQVQAQNEDLYEAKYRARGYKTVMVLHKNLSGMIAYPDQASCTAGINAWRANYDANYTILCDVDVDGNGTGDVWEQFNRCSGVPSNYYMDRNWSIFAFDCGFNSAAETDYILPKAWPEWCE